MRKIIFVVMVLIGFSCENEPVNSEQEIAINYLKANGFEVGTINSSSSLRKIVSLREAREIVDEMRGLIGTFNGEIKSVSEKTGRNSLIACEDAGAYYINRAIDGVISGVDVTYTIDTSGNIRDIFSFSTGLVLAWGWDQLNVNIFNPKTSFCINGVITYGVDFNGIPLGYRQAIALRVTLRGCAYEVTSRNGTC